MKLNKIVTISAITLLFMASCSNWKDSEIPSPEVSANSPAARFASTNPASFEIPPSNDMSFTLTVIRDSEAKANALDVPITIISDSAFTVPSTVSFAAGSATATLQIKIDPTATPGSTLPLAISLDNADANPYKAEYSSYYGKILISPWVSMGTAQFYDDFIFAEWADEPVPYVAEVSIDKNFLDPNSFRISYPYTDDILKAVGDDDGSMGGTTQANIVFTINGDNVTWSKFWYTSLLYDGDGTDIKAYLPSAINKDGDSKSVVVRDADGNIEYFELYPYYYIDGLGGFGLFPVYLGFPGFDLSGELGVPIFQ